MAVAPRIDVSRIKVPVYVKVGDILSLNAHVTGSPPPRVSWYVGDKKVKNGTQYRIKESGFTHTLQIRDVTEDIGQGVFVTATNPSGREQRFIDCKIYKVLRRRRRIKRAKSQTLPPQVMEAYEPRKTIRIFRQGDAGSVKSLPMEEQRRASSLGRINYASPNEDVVYHYTDNIAHGAETGAEGQFSQGAVAPRVHSYGDLLAHERMHYSLPPDSISYTDDVFRGSGSGSGQGSRSVTPLDSATSPSSRASTPPRYYVEQVPGAHSDDPGATPTRGATVRQVKRHSHTRRSHSPTVRETTGLSIAPGETYIPGDMPYTISNDSSAPLEIRHTSLVSAAGMDDPGFRDRPRYAKSPNEMKHTSLVGSAELDDPRYQDRPRYAKAKSLPQGVEASFLYLPSPERAEPEYMSQESGYGSITKSPTIAPPPLKQQKFHRPHEDSFVSEEPLFVAAIQESPKRRRKKDPKKENTPPLEELPPTGLDAKSKKRKSKKPKAPDTSDTVLLDSAYPVEPGVRNPHQNGNQLKTQERSEPQLGRPVSQPVTYREETSYMHQTKVVPVEISSTQRAPEPPKEVHPEEPATDTKAKKKKGLKNPFKKLMKSKKSKEKSQPVEPSPELERPSKETPNTKTTASTTTVFLDKPQPPKTITDSWVSDFMTSSKEHPDPFTADDEPWERELLASRQEPMETDIDGFGEPIIRPGRDVPLETAIDDPMEVEDSSPKPTETDLDELEGSWEPEDKRRSAPPQMMSQSWDEEFIRSQPNVWAVNGVKMSNLCGDMLNGYQNPEAQPEDGADAETDAGTVAGTEIQHLVAEINDYTGQEQTPGMDQKPPKSPRPVFKPLDFSSPVQDTSTDSRATSEPPGIMSKTTRRWIKSESAIGMGRRKKMTSHASFDGLDDRGRKMTRSGSRSSQPSPGSRVRITLEHKKTITTESIENITSTISMSSFSSASSLYTTASPQPPVLSSPGAMSSDYVFMPSDTTRRSTEDKMSKSMELYDIPYVDEPMQEFPGTKSVPNINVGYIETDLDDVFDSAIITQNITGATEAPLATSEETRGILFVENISLEKDDNFKKSTDVLTTLQTEVVMPSSKEKTDVTTKTITQREVNAPKDINANQVVTTKKTTTTEIIRTEKAPKPKSTSPEKAYKQYTEVDMILAQARPLEPAPATCVVSPPKTEVIVTEKVAKAKSPSPEKTYRQYTEVDIIQAPGKEPVKNKKQADTSCVVSPPKTEVIVTEKAPKTKSPSPEKTYRQYTEVDIIRTSETPDKETKEKSDNVSYFVSPPTTEIIRTEKPSQAKNPSPEKSFKQYSAVEIIRVPDEPKAEDTNGKNDREFYVVSPPTTEVTRTEAPKETKSKSPETSYKQYTEVDIIRAPKKETTGDDTNDKQSDAAYVVSHPTVIETIQTTKENEIRSFDISEASHTSVEHHYRDEEMDDTSENELDRTDASSKQNEISTITTSTEYVLAPPRNDALDMSMETEEAATYESDLTQTKPSTEHSDIKATDTVVTSKESKEVTHQEPTIIKTLETISPADASAQSNVTITTRTIVTETKEDKQAIHEDQYPSKPKITETKQLSVTPEEPGTTSHSYVTRTSVIAGADRKQPTEQTQDQTRLVSSLETELIEDKPVAPKEVRSIQTSQAEASNTKTVVTTVRTALIQRDTTSEGTVVKDNQDSEPLAEVLNERSTKTTATKPTTLDLSHSPEYNSDNDWSDGLVTSPIKEDVILVEPEEELDETDWAKEFIAQSGSVVKRNQVVTQARTTITTEEEMEVSEDVQPDPETTYAEDWAIEMLTESSDDQQAMTKTSTVTVVTSKFEKSENDDVPDVPESEQRQESDGESDADMSVDSDVTDEDEDVRGSYDITIETTDVIDEVEEMEDDAQDTVKYTTTTEGGSLLKTTVVTTRVSTGTIEELPETADEKKMVIEQPSNKTVQNTDDTTSVKTTKVITTTESADSSNQSLVEYEKKEYVKPEPDAEENIEEEQYLSSPETDAIQTSTSVKTTTIKTTVTTTADNVQITKESPAKEEPEEKKPIGATESIATDSTSLPTTVVTSKLISAPEDKPIEEIPAMGEPAEEEVADDDDDEDDVSIDSDVTDEEGGVVQSSYDISVVEDTAGITEVPEEEDSAEEQPIPSDTEYTSDDDRQEPQELASTSETTTTTVIKTTTTVIKTTEDEATIKTTQNEATEQPQEHTDPTIDITRTTTVTKTIEDERKERPPPEHPDPTIAIKTTTTVIETTEDEPKEEPEAEAYPGPQEDDASEDSSGEEYSIDSDITDEEGGTVEKGSYDINVPVISTLEDVEEDEEEPEQEPEEISEEPEEISEEPKDVIDYSPTIHETRKTTEYVSAEPSDTKLFGVTNVTVTTTKTSITTEADHTLKVEETQLDGALKPEEPVDIHEASEADDEDSSEDEEATFSEGESSTHTKTVVTTTEYGTSQVRTIDNTTVKTETVKIIDEDEDVPKPVTQKPVEEEEYFSEGESSSHTKTVITTTEFTTKVDLDRDTNFTTVTPKPPIEPKEKPERKALKERDSDEDSMYSEGEYSSHTKTVITTTEFEKRHPGSSDSEYYEEMFEQQMQEMEMEIPMLTFETQPISPESRKKPRPRPISIALSDNDEIPEMEVFETSEMVHYRLKRYSVIDGSMLPDSPTRKRFGSLSLSLPEEQVVDTRERLTSALKEFIPQRGSDSDSSGDERLSRHYSSPRSTTFKVTNKGLFHQTSSEAVIRDVFDGYEHITTKSMPDDDVTVTHKQHVVVMQPVEDVFEAPASPLATTHPSQELSVETDLVRPRTRSEPRYSSPLSSPRSPSTRSPKQKSRDVRPRSKSDSVGKVTHIKMNEGNLRRHKRAMSELDPIENLREQVSDVLQESYMSNVMTEIVKDAVARSVIEDILLDATSKSNIRRVLESPERSVPVSPRRSQDTPSNPKALSVESRPENPYESVAKQIVEDTLNKCMEEVAEEMLAKELVSNIMHQGVQEMSTELHQLQDILSDDSGDSPRSNETTKTIKQTTVKTSSSSSASGKPLLTAYHKQDGKSQRTSKARTTVTRTTTESARGFRDELDDRTERAKTSSKALSGTDDEEEIQLLAEDADLTSDQSVSSEEGFLMSPVPASQPSQGGVTATSMAMIPEECSLPEAKTTLGDTEELDTVPGILLYGDTSGHVADETDVSMVTHCDTDEYPGRKGHVMEDVMEDVVNLETPSCSYTSSTFGSLSSTNYEAIMQEIKIEIQRLEDILLTGTEGDEDIQTEIRNLKEEYKTIAGRFSRSGSTVSLDSIDWSSLTEAQSKSLASINTAGLMVSAEDMCKLEDMLKFGGCKDGDIEEILNMVREHLKQEEVQEEDEDEVKEEELDQIMEDLAEAMSPREEKGFSFETKSNKTKPKEPKESKAQTSKETKTQDETSGRDSALDDLCAANTLESDTESLGEILASNQETVNQCSVSVQLSQSQELNKSAGKQIVESTVRQCVKEEIEGSKSSKTEGSKSSKTEGSKSSKTEASKSSKTEGSKSSKTEGSKSSKTEGSNSSKTEASKSSKTESSNSSKTEASKSSKTEASKSSKTEGSKSSKTEASKSSKTQGSKSSKQEDKSAKETTVESKSGSTSAKPEDKSAKKLTDESSSGENVVRQRTREGATANTQEDEDESLESQSLERAVLEGVFSHVGLMFLLLVTLVVWHIMDWFCRHVFSP